MNTRTNRRICTQVVREIEADFQRCAGLILTENDLQCLLHSRLSAAFPVEPSHDAGHLASPVHSEVSWFDRSNRLKIKPDISLFEPRNLRLFDGFGMSLPSKGFHGVGSAIIFELKFFRSHRGPSDKELEAVWDDLEKIQALLHRIEADGGNGMVHCFFVEMNRTDRRQNESEDVFTRFSRRAGRHFTDHVDFAACSGLVARNRHVA